jgi:hypothetical protein
MDVSVVWWFALAREKGLPPYTRPGAQLPDPQLFDLQGQIV